MSDVPTIYLNHAGTSWPKPPTVQAAVTEAMQAEAKDWPGQFEAAHWEIAAFFGLNDPQQLLLTPGCTSSLSVAVADHAWQSGDRVLTSGLEHHALHRPLVKLTEQRVKLEIVPPSSDSPIDLDQLQAELRSGGVRMVAVSAASNVTGELFFLPEIIELAHQYGALALIDAAQVVGWKKLDLPALGADLVAFGGHKGLQAPWGIGGLYVAPQVKMECVAATCEIPRPGEACGTRPTYCDAGSVDRIALAGLQASVRWLAAEERRDRLERARQLTAGIWETLSRLDGIRLFGSADPRSRLPTIAFTSEQHSPPEITAALAEQGILVAAGLQCAPLAHQTLGTDPHGVVRLSLGPSTTAEEAEACHAALCKVLG